MAENGSAVFGIYSTRAALEAAVEALRAKGFQSTEISVLSVQPPEPTVSAPEVAKEDSSASRGAVAAVGGTLGWLAGLSALAMAGSVFIVAGPIMAALAKMGVTVDNIAGTLRTFGVPEVEAEHYQGRIASGGLLLSVHTEDAASFAEGTLVLEQTGADAITSTRHLAVNEVMTDARPPTDLSLVSPARAAQ